MACRDRRKNQRTPQPPQPPNKPNQPIGDTPNMETTIKQTGTITGQLSTLADIFSTVALYASTDPNKPNLQLATINGYTVEACDSYAAIRYELFQTTYETTANPFTLPAADIAKALTNAAKIRGKHTEATITATLCHWFIETPSGNISGDNPQHETPNTAQIWTDTQTKPAEPFQPISLAQWQLERIAKTTKQGKAKRDSIATLTHYTNPNKPLIYTIETWQGKIQVLAMTCKTNK